MNTFRYMVLRLFNGAQTESLEEVLDLIDDIRGSLEETFEAIAESSAE
ncbi:MAG: hypothetical protein KAQ69_13030 [Spirochaetales bacterium]|nr:hypothetical protein [Spirochaetales bacterium]